ncbi:MAG: GAF domain-containing sensor histidine kinase [Desulfuromonadales bacterium]|nr:GAF domain-containing sensor histidine kinase [Desulfuromonadales bacterium]
MTYVELEQDNQRLLLLQRVALYASDNLAQAELFNLTLAELQRFFSVDGCGIYQFRTIDSPRVLTAHLGIEPQLARELQKIPVGQGLTEQVLQSNRPCHWTDLSGASNLYCQAVLDAGWRSLLALPLKTPRQTVGTLFLFQRIRRQFSHPEIELLERICRILANATAMTELLEKLEWQQKQANAAQHELERSRAQLRAHLLRLEDSYRALEQTNRSRTRFLGVASHELRTPLTCILSAAEILQLKLPEAEEEILQLIATVEQNALRLQSLIDDLLEMARIESRDLYLAKEPLDLEQLLTALQFEFNTQQNDREIDLTLTQLSAGSVLLGDRHHLLRALQRLLDNAVKFTPPKGRIHLKTCSCDKSELHHKRLALEKFCPDFFATPLADEYLLLQIRDSGSGIPPDQRLSIFDTFHSAAMLKHHGNNPKTGTVSGIGLGLPLARGIVEGHGGMIWVDSAADGEPGSIFHVLLPLYHLSHAPGVTP